MELGQRLKQARLEAGLSQRQLCGEEITRNMLSQIENGSARPSMATLEYFARRLGKTVSYFLEEDTVCSPNQSAMEQARKHYGEGEWLQALQGLEQYKDPDPVFDPERWLLEALCLMALARKALTEGKVVYYETLLERAGEAGRRTYYYTPALERERILLLSCGGVRENAKLLEQLPQDPREQYLRAGAALEAKDYKRCAAVLDGMPGDTPRWHFLRGEAAGGMGEYASAAEHYLLAEEAYPAECIPALENCYRELGDYKNAYVYACKQRNL